MHTLTPSSRCRIAATFPVLTPSSLRSRAVPCSDRRQMLQGVSCHWHKCTRKGSRMRKCRLNCRRNRRKARGPCGLACRRLYTSSWLQVCRNQGLLAYLCLSRPAGCVGVSECVCVCVCVSECVSVCVSV